MMHTKLFRSAWIGALTTAFSIGSVVSSAAGQTPTPPPPTVLDGGAPRGDASGTPGLSDAGVDGGVPAPLPPHADGGIPEPLPSETRDAGTGDAGPPVVEVAAEPQHEETAPTSEEPVEVLVVGTRLARTAGSAHVVREAQLERFEYDDPHRVLLTVPGLYVRGEDALGLRPNIGLRGVNPDRSKKITFLEDGVLFAPAPYSAPAAYYFPIITRMTQVRVIKGPGAIAFGPHTVGGTIDLITRPIPTETEGAFDLSIGEYGYGKGHGYFGYSDGQVGFLIEGIHLRTDGFKELQGDDDADTGFERNEWMFRGSYVLNPSARVQNEFQLKLTYSDEDSRETYLGLSDADFRADPLQRYGVTANDRMRNHRTAIAFTHVIEPTSDLTITTTAYRNDFKRTWRKVNHFRGADLFTVLTDPENPTNAIYYDVLRGEIDSSTREETLFIGPNERLFVSQGIQTQLRLDAQTGPFSHRAEVGVRLHNDRVRRRHTEDGFLVIDGQLVSEGEPTVVTAFNRAETTAVSLHAMDAITWRGLSLTPGVRVELISSWYNDFQAGSDNRRFIGEVLPGVGAFYAFTDTFGVLGGVYRGFSPPPPAPNDDADPELSVNYEAGARFTDGPMRAELIGFYNDYSNLSDLCTFSTGCVDESLDRQFDAGEAQILGLEAYAEHTLELGIFKLPFTLAYTLTHTEFSQSFMSDDPIFGDVEEGDEMPYVPRHQLSASLGLETDLAGGVVSTSYVSRMREEAGSGSLDDTLATDEQLVFDIGAWVRPIDHFKFYANVRNLFDEVDIASRRPYGARPTAPRWIQIGVKAEM